MKSYIDSLKSQEDTNKQLKAEVRKQKAAKEKLEKEDTSKAASVKQEQVKTEPSPIREEPEKMKEISKVKPPIKELILITLIAQREKLCRDDLTAMMLAGEESLKMLIRKPSDQLIDFIKDNLHDEDAILAAIPRFEMPKTDFETQVLREMRIVMKDNADNFQKNVKDELLTWEEFEEVYSKLDDFEYPHTRTSCWSSLSTSSSTTLWTRRRL